MTETPYPASTLPAPASIVWGRFPYVEKPGVPGEDSHPCLVLGWNEYRDGLFSVLVVFGTSQVGKHDRFSNLVVTNFRSQWIAGLCKETVFVYERWKWLPWTDWWFMSPDPKRWSTPVIGQLTPGLRKILRYQLQEREAGGLPGPPRPPSTAPSA